MTYKLLKSDDKDMFEPAWSSSTKGHSAKLLCKHAKTRKRNNFFNNQIVGLWNSLSERMVGSVTIDSFKSNLNKDWLKKPWLTQWNAADILQPHYH
jgi:hypothetical protein